MKTILQLKRELRESLLKGIPESFVILKEALPEHSEKFNSLILLESRYLEVERQSVRGTLSAEKIQIAKNEIREELLNFITRLSDQDLLEPDPEPDAPQPPAPARPLLPFSFSARTWYYIGGGALAILALALLIPALKGKRTDYACHAPLRSETNFAGSAVGTAFLILSSDYAMALRAVDSNTVAYVPFQGFDDFSPFLWTIEADRDRFAITSGRYQKVIAAGENGLFLTERVNYSDRDRQRWILKNRPDGQVIWAATDSLCLDFPAGQPTFGCCSDTLSLPWNFVPVVHSGPNFEIASGKFPGFRIRIDSRNRPELSERSDPGKLWRFRIADFRDSTPYYYIISAERTEEKALEVDYQRTDLSGNAFPLKLFDKTTATTKNPGILWKLTSYPRAGMPQAYRITSAVSNTESFCLDLKDGNLNGKNKGVLQVYDFFTGLDHQLWQLIPDTAQQAGQ